VTGPAFLVALLTLLSALHHVTDAHAQTPPVQPFAIAVEEAVIEDLHRRLAQARWPDQIPGSGWTYGADGGYLLELAAYWREEFDWRAQERRLNTFDQYFADVDGLGIHFIHQRSRDPAALPLLLLHGWPSSFVQMLDLIPRLTDPAAHGAPGAQAFHVVAASLPGFGFSAIPEEPGVAFRRSGDALARVMVDALGYPRFGVRGSDLGERIARQIALGHPQHVIGLHLSGIIGTTGAAPPYTEAERRFIDASAAIETQLAYARLHMAEPQTLAYALNDSPVGLAAWIVQRFRAWGDTGGNVESRFSKDDLLTNLTIYWVTGTINSSMRMYYEFAREQARMGRIEPPVGMLMSTRDLFPAAPREWGQRLYEVVRWTETDTGGHFLEWEEPDLVASELRAFFEDL
jgi:pimeloyl-ACP methyl ester carboxylesterase